MATREEHYSRQRKWSVQRPWGVAMTGMFEEQHGGQCGKIRVSEQERPAWEVRSVCDRAGCCPALRSG